MKKRRNNNRKSSLIDRVIALLIVLLAITLMIAAYALIWNGHAKKKPTETIDFSETDVSPETKRETQESPETPSEEESTEEETSYPEPEYDFQTEEVTIPIKGISKEYTFAWVSDLHLVSDHKAGEEAGDALEEDLEAINKRYEELSVTKDGVHAEELWPEIVKYLNYNEFDGIIFGGDMMDYCSNSNVAQIKDGLDKLRTPYIYVRADHDYGSYYGGEAFTETQARELHKTIDNDEIAYKFWDKNDFIILGIDNSTKDMPDYYLNMVKDVYSRGKPVIMATHVPYESQSDASLAELSMKVRNTIYYWSDASDRYKPNDVTKQYLDLIYDKDTVVEQVLAGHVHASWDGMISKQVPQHIFAPAYSGNIGIIHIVPESE